VTSAALIWSDNPGLINVALTSVALTKSLTMPAIKVRSDIVSDNSGSDNAVLTRVALTWSLTIPALIHIALTSAL